MKKVRKFFAKLFKRQRRANTPAQEIHANDTKKNSFIREEIVRKEHSGYPLIVVQEVDIGRNKDVETQPKVAIQTSISSKSESKDSLFTLPIPTTFGNLDGMSKSFTDTLWKDNQLERESSCGNARLSSLSAPPSPTMQTKLDVLKIHTKFSNNNLYSLNSAEEDITPYCSCDSIDVQTNSDTLPSTFDFLNNTALKRVYENLGLSPKWETNVHVSAENLCSLPDFYSFHESTESVFEADGQQEDNVLCYVEKKAVISNVSSGRNNLHRGRIYSTSDTKQSAFSFYSSKQADCYRKMNVLDLPSLYRN